MPYLITLWVILVIVYALIGSVIVGAYRENFEVERNVLKRVSVMTFWPLVLCYGVIQYFKECIFGE